MWFKYLLIALFALSAICQVCAIGNEREPITKGQAILNIIIDVTLILGIIHYLD